MATASLDRPQPLWLFRVGVLAGWVLFLLMVVAITWAGAVVRERKFELAATVVWNLGWLLWTGATFLVARLARRFPLERGNLGRGILLHVGGGIAVSAAILCAEFALSAGLQRLWPEMLPTNALIGFFVYKFHIYFLIYWMILGGTRAFDTYARLRESEILASRLEAQLAHAQLHALKMQLHPHFLFNTHHSIISLMLKNENPAAIKMLTRLSELLRITLSQSDRQVTSLREELAALDLYLGIQKERYRERLTVEFEIEPAALEADVPCLLLQPIVENALKHGIDSLATEGKLRVKAWRRDGMLGCTVTDNGPGLAREFELEKQTGLGLRNTKARLERLYGREHEFELRTAPDGGVEVRIAFPFRLAQPVEMLAL